jgi:hypothetical protein
MRSTGLVSRPVSCVLLLPLVFCACGPAEASSEVAAAGEEEPDHASDRATGEQQPLLRASHDPIWWLHPTVNGGVAACVGRVVEDAEAGPVRQWTLTCALAGTTTPMACLEGAVPIHSSDPLRLEGSFFTVELRPRGGLSWDDVRTREDLESLVQGLD